jgi:hypothetical protein
MSPAQWNARAAQAALCNSALAPGVQEWPHRLAQIPSRKLSWGFEVCAAQDHSDICRLPRPNKSVADGSCLLIQRHGSAGLHHFFWLTGECNFPPQAAVPEDSVDTSPMLLAIKSAEDAHAS